MTKQICPECKGKPVLNGSETTCSKCGLVLFEGIEGIEGITYITRWKH